MEIKAIIFDFDMTLVDTSRAIAYAMNRFAEIMGLRKVSYDEVLATIGLPMEKSLSVLWQGQSQSGWTSTQGNADPWNMRK